MFIIIETYFTATLPSLLYSLIVACYAMLKPITWHWHSIMLCQSFSATISWNAQVINGYCRKLRIGCFVSGRHAEERGCIQRPFLLGCASVFTYHNADEYQVFIDWYCFWRYINCEKHTGCSLLSEIVISVMPWNFFVNLKKRSLHQITLVSLVISRLFQ